MRFRASGAHGGLSYRGDERPHILVVDGSLPIRMDLRASLHGAGFNVTACESRTSARQALRVRTYGVAVLDAHLPDGSGVDFIKEIRAVQPGVRTVVTAADADPQMRALAVAAGAEDLLRKPLDMVSLLRLAVKLVGSPGRPRSFEAPRLSGPRRRVLIIDADPVFRRILADSIRGDGEEVLVASSAEEAMALLNADRVDALLVDFRLPEVSGLELCRRVRGQSLQRSVPILVVARPADDVDAYRKAMAAGADDLVVRSNEPAIVKVRLRSLLSRAEKEREKREGKGRSPLDELSASLPAPNTQKLAAMAALKKRSVPPPPPVAAARGNEPSVPPPPGGSRASKANTPSVPPRSPFREEPDAAAVSGWVRRRESDDQISGIVSVGADSSREPRSQPASRHPSSAGKK